MKRIRVYTDGSVAVYDTDSGVNFRDDPNAIANDVEATPENLTLYLGEELAKRSPFDVVELS